MPWPGKMLNSLNAHFSYLRGHVPVPSDHAPPRGATAFTHLTTIFGPKHHPRLASQGRVLATEFEQTEACALVSALFWYSGPLDNGARALDWCRPPLLDMVLRVCATYPYLSAHAEWAPSGSSSALDDAERAKQRDATSSALRGVLADASFAKLAIGASARREPHAPLASALATDGDDARRRADDGGASTPRDAATVGAPPWGATPRRPAQGESKLPSVEYARAPPSEVDVGEQEKDLTHIQARAAPIESGIVVEFELLPV